MTQIKEKSEKRKMVGYWSATGLLAFGMLSGGIAHISQLQANVDGIIRLGYPLYVMSILGGWKIVGVVVLLIPGFALLKEWAYAGFFFVLTGAIASHLASGDGLGELIAPMVLLIFTLVSWGLRPSNRKILEVTTQNQ